jgi:PAS domain S-box-containing protein
MHAPTDPQQPHALSRRLLLGFLFAAVMLALLAAISYQSSAAFLKAARDVGTLTRLLETNERLRRHFTELESTARGYAISGDATANVNYTRIQGKIVSGITVLRTQASAFTAVQESLDTVDNLYRSLVTQHEDLLSLRRENNPLPPDLIPVADNILHEVGNAFTGVDSALRESIDQKAEETTNRRTVTSVLSLGTAIFTIAALGFAGWRLHRDIRVRRKVESDLHRERELLQRVLDTMPDAVFVKDLTGHYVRSNLAHLRRHGLPGESALRGKTAADLYPKGLADSYRESDAWVLKFGSPLLNQVEQGITTSGKAVWYETSKVPLRGDRGQLIGLLGVSSDITERRNAEEQLRHYSSELRRSNEELQNFASVASHDLQEPLRKILAFGDRLQARCGPELSEQGRDFLNRMLDAAARMQSLIQDILKLARVTSRALPFVPCDLNRVIAGVAADLEVMIAQSGAGLIIDPLPTLMADQAQMRQLFQNLIQNSLKFHTHGVPPEIRVTARQLLNSEADLPGCPPDESLVEIVVRDNGIGFDPQFAEKIFVVFQRLHSRTEFEGTGIGLALCRKIVERHRGKIVATSLPGHGATFRITLPENQPLLPDTSAPLEQEEVS